MLGLFVLFRLSTARMRPTTRGRAVCFIRFTHSTVNVTQKHPYRHPQGWGAM